MSDIKFFILMLVIFWIGNFFSLLLLYPVALLDTEDDSNTTNSAQARSIWRLHANDHESVEHTFGSLFRTFFASMNMVRKLSWLCTDASRDHCGFLVNDAVVRRCLVNLI